MKNRFYIIQRLLLVCSLWFCVAVTKAQLCQGSLGDPIVNITFGKGSMIDPLPASVTTYQYVNGDCPNDGQYTIRGNTNSCFSSSWHTLNIDHTGDGNGRFMLVNASFAAGAFYKDTIKNLCANTTYEFAAWVINMLKSSACSGTGIKPNLTFTIERTDGTVINTYNTGDIASTNNGQWVQYGFFFKTPAAISSIVLRIVNNAPGGCGNDLALDDITFRPCGPQLSPSINGITGNQKDLCVGVSNTVTMQCATSGGFTNPAYQWQQSTDNGATWTDITGATTTTLVRNYPANTPAGTYLYRMVAAELENILLTSCRVSSAVFTIRINPLPVVSISGDPSVCEQSSLDLTASGGATYQWTGPAGFTATTATINIPAMTFSNAGIYTVKVTTAAGCSRQEPVIVSVRTKPNVQVTPTAALVCEGKTVTLTATGATSYTWQPATGLSSTNAPQTTATVNSNIVYSVIGITQNCTDTAQAALTVVQLPKPNAGRDTFTREGQPIQLQGSITGNHAGYQWLPVSLLNDATVLTPLALPTDDTSFILKVQALQSCGEVSDTVKVKVFKRLDIPNSFSPNGDGINDTWRADALLAYPRCRIMVFNRNGNVVYESNGYKGPWNGTFQGKLLPAGTYYYIIETGVPQEPDRNGWLLIIR